MYGTTIRSYNESKNTKPRNNRIEKPQVIESNKEPKKLRKKQHELG